MFTLDYQIKLLAQLCLDKEFFLKFSTCLDDENFTSQVSQWLCDVLSRHFVKYKELPTKTIFEQEYLSKQVSFLPEELVFYQGFLKLIEQQSVPEVVYIKDTVERYVVSRTLKKTLNEISDEIETGNADLVLSRLKSDVSNFVKPSTSLKDQFVFSIHNLEEIYNVGGGIRAGINLIDAYIGGLLTKELGIILADTNVGKSILLSYVGGQIVRQLRRVLHVTLEMSAARTLLRYYTTLSEKEDNIRYTDLKDPNQLEQTYDYLLKLRNRYENYLFVEELPTGKGTINDFSRLIDKYDPQVFIVDYLDLIKPVKKRDQPRFELQDLTVALRGLAIEHDIPILTATQATRTAAGRRIIGKQFAAEDYGKMRVADWAIGMGQTVEDALRHEVVLYLTKSRNTEKDKAERYLIDFNSMKFMMVRPELLRNEQSGS